MVALGMRTLDLASAVGGAIASAGLGRQRHLIQS
jgi:hypothetical protein